MNTQRADAALQVEIWSDPVCPFCYMGEHNLKAGIVLYGGAVETVYRSFQLRPDLPFGSDTNFVEMFAKRRGVSTAQARELIAPAAAQGTAMGLELDFERARPTNTRRAHELLHFAKSKGKQDAMAERIFMAYFTEGLLISDPDTLADLAAGIGLDRVETAQALAERNFVPAVEDDIATAHRIGVNSVPHIVINSALAISGSQSPAIFASALRQAASKRPSDKA